MTLEEMKNIYGISEKTIKKNLDKIPGAIVEKNRISFINGTRYPFFNIRYYKLNDSEKRRFVLLKAISQFKYIDCVMLKVTQDDFLLYLKQLLNEGWIEENNSSNSYGANRYNITIQGEEELEQKEKKHILTTAKTFGTFIGTVISQVWTNNE